MSVKKCNFNVADTLDYHLISICAQSNIACKKQQLFSILSQRDSIVTRTAFSLRPTGISVDLFPDNDLSFATCQSIILVTSKFYNV